MTFQPPEQPVEDFPLAEAKAAIDDAERRAAQAREVFNAIQGGVEKFEGKREALKAAYQEAFTIGTKETIGKLKARLNRAEDELNCTLRTLVYVQDAVRVADQRYQAATKYYEAVKKRVVARNPNA